MSGTPSSETIAAIERGTVTITRRIEFYESDGVTRWYPQPDDKPRLVDGSVSVDYDRDERRSLDTVLLNDDNLLRPNSQGGLWYDKVLKVFRGVTYKKSIVSPKIAIIEAQGTGNAAYQFRSILVGMGYINADILTSATTSDEVKDYEIVLSYSGTAALANSTLLKSLYGLGKKIVTIGVGSAEGDIPFITSSFNNTGAAITWGIDATTADNPLKESFTAETAAPTSVGKLPTAYASTAQAVARTSFNSTWYNTAFIDKNTSGGRWFDLHLPNINGTQAKSLLAAAIEWLRDYQEDVTWETQMGEYVIDNLSEANFPNQIKVTGRDYTKRCLGSKFEHAVEFSSTTKIIDLVRALAVSAGITKFKLPVLAQTVGKTISIERGTSRWDVMKAAAAAGNLEIFFDNEGYLVLRPFLDPALSPAGMVFKTGSDGNLVTYDRSANDSRLYNHVCVFGDPADGEEARLPYFGEAENTDPGSPTRISRIGDRYYSFASQFFTSDAQCQAYANSLLKIVALESYDLNMSSIYYPWLEAGIIVEIQDPDALSSDPTKFLLSNITFPIALGPMSVQAKRVTYVPTGD